MEFALIITEVVMPTDLNLNPVNWNTLVAGHNVFHFWQTQHHILAFFLKNANFLTFQ